jgi:hypothetical protein
MHDRPRNPCFEYVIISAINEICLRRAAAGVRGGIRPVGGRLLGVVKRRQTTRRTRNKRTKTTTIMDTIWHFWHEWSRNPRREQRSASQRPVFLIWAPLMPWIVIYSILFLAPGIQAWLGTSRTRGVWTVLWMGERREPFQFLFGFCLRGLA